VPLFSSPPSRKAVAVAAIVLAFPFRAAAELDEPPAPSADKIRLEYRAPPECPDGETFKGLVGSRVPAVWEAAPDELARRVDVEVSVAESRYVATIELVDERGERILRAVRGMLCPDVVDGIALVTALVIQSRVEEALERSEPVAAAAPVPPPLAPVAPKAPPAPPAAPPRAPSAPSSARDEPSLVALRVTARAAVSTGVGPDVAPGATFGFTYERGSARLGVALQGFWTGSVEAGGVPARFSLLAARLEGCPYVVSFADWASLEPCPFAELGSATGEALDDPPAVDQGFPGSAPWLSLGGVGRAVGRFGALVVELEAALGVPIVREEFYIQGGDVVYRVPALYGAVAAGIGARF
jgi:hypothetical protein